LGLAGMFAVEVYAAVRQFVFNQGKSRREAARVFGLSRETVAKMCRFSLPPGYRRWTGETIRCQAHFCGFLRFNEDIFNWDPELLGMR